MSDPRAQKREMSATKVPCVQYDCRRRTVSHNLPTRKHYLKGDLIVKRKAAV